MTAEQDRVRGYLLGQAERYDWLDLWPRVTAARVELLDAVRDVTDEQAAWKPAEEEWSILEVMRHALASSRDCMRVIEALARGETAVRERAPGEQPDEAPHTLGEVRREVAAHSAEFAGLPLRLPAEPDLERTAKHMFFGELNSRAWYLFQRVHDMDHVNQVKQNQAAEGYPAA